jgi:hypothetical protein
VDKRVRTQKMREGEREIEGGGVRELGKGGGRGREGWGGLEGR